MHFASVAIPTPVHSTFTYIVPDDIHLTPGSRVVVGFGKRRVIGVCVTFTDEPPEGLDPTKLKQVEAQFDEPPVFGPNLLKLVSWVAEYYCAPIGEVCRAALPTRLLKIAAPKTTRPSPPAEIKPIHKDKFTLHADQSEAIDLVLSNPTGVTLLHGITGSGKTRVYLEIFAKIIPSGGQGLLLVPEIGLTPQLTGEALAHFGKRVAVYHSGLTDAQRHEAWSRMRGGEVSMVIGTRCAVFAPLPNLGAIIVDEEHDPSYKQDDGVAYNGRDLAVMRAHIEGIRVILGSATPSIESLANARRGKYAYHRLSSRPSGSRLPTVEIVDMRGPRTHESERKESEGKKKGRELVSLSPRLYDAIKETLARREQALIYIGRRGFASALQCNICGTVPICPNCDIALTLHRGQFATGDGRLVRQQKGGEALACHYCGHCVPVPNICTACNRGAMFPIGQGTERIEAEIKDFFPNARVARLDSDVASSPIRRRKALDEMRRGKIDILVGTQMVTKGHDFPSITLVGVVGADMSLHMPDFRSAERTFQLLTQVAGRAGRGPNPGHVIIQTMEPKHVSFIAAQGHNCASFAAQEIEHRRRLSYPPFSRLANIRLSANKEDIVKKAAHSAAGVVAGLLSRIENGRGISVLGPAPAPFMKLRGRYRWQILIKSPNSAILARLLSTARPAIEKTLPSSVRFMIDVDPINLL